jgi:hypothetical protein
VFVGDGEDVGLLDRTFAEGFYGADREVSVEIDGGGRGGVVVSLRERDAGFEPVKDTLVGSSGRFIFVMGADMPDAELAVSAEEVGAAMDDLAGLGGKCWDCEGKERR